jgi:YggT family protein
MIGFLIQIIQSVAWVLTVLILADVIVSYFMNPYHPIRSFLDRIVQPMLLPIQRILPSFGGIDFSPIVLFLLIQLVETFLINILVAL